MKSCLLCHTQAEDSAATCPGCGHADWAPVVVAEEAPPPEPTPEPAATSKQSQRKRGR